MLNRLRRGGLELGALLLAAVLAATPAAARADEPKVVLELFTSQGCSSCPAADALLGDLAATRDDVIALSFHVDYWNYLGWEDRFATAEMTARQRAYARVLGVSYVYTPQLVVDGVRHVTGSDRNAVTAEIREAKARTAARVPVAVRSSAPDRLVVEIAAAADIDDGAAAVWLVTFDRRYTTTVDAGENRGRTLVNHHVVRDYRRVGTWDGDAMTLELGPGDVPDAPETAGEGRAVLVQAGRGNGRILGADAVWVEGAG